MSEETKVKVVRKIGYKVVMSRGDDIPVDEDEIAKIVAAIQAGSPVRVRAAIFNPSFYVSIVKDKERVQAFLEDTKYDDGKRSSGMKAIADIFATAPLRLPTVGKNKALGTGE